MMLAVNNRDYGFPGLDRRRAGATFAVQNKTPILTGLPEAAPSPVARVAPPRIGMSVQVAI